MVGSAAVSVPPVRLKLPVRSKRSERLKAPVTVGVTGATGAGGWSEARRAGRTTGVVLP